MFYLGLSIGSMIMFLIFLIAAINGSRKSSRKIHDEMKELLISRNEMLKYQNVLFTEIWQYVSKKKENVKEK